MRIKNSLWLWLIFCFLGLLSVSGSPAQSVRPAQVLTDPNQAFTLAQASGKPVLLIFSGSDWCAPCIRLEREVLSDSSFLRFARQHLIVLKADFPQRKKPDHSWQAAYEKLADSHNQEGAFPKLVVLSSDQKNRAPLSLLRPTPATFIAELQRILNRMGYATPLPGQRPADGFRF